jgi:hypothetical protein
VCVFFFFEIWFQKNLAAFTKFLLAENKGFWQWLQYFPSPDFCRRYFKKNTHPDWVLVTTKKISARYKKVSIFARGKLLVVFGPWDFQKSQKDVSGNSESMTTFALLIEIYLPCNFHKFPLSHFLETPETRGGVLKLQNLIKIRLE